MNDSEIFNLYFQNSEYIGNSASPISLFIEAYKTGNFLSIFSGSFISNVSGSTFENVGVKDSYSSDNILFNLYFPNVTYLGVGNDIVYNTLVYDYHSGTIINDYSSSNINNISLLTITDFVERPV